MEEIFKWISVTGRFSQIYLNNQFKRLGINCSQHMFIKKICDNEGITQDKLGDIVYINKSNITRALTQLEENGFLIKRIHARDKRTAQLYPTEKARKIYPEIIRIENEWNKIITAQLTDGEKQDLLRILKKIAHTSVDFVRREE